MSRLGWIFTVLLTTAGLLAGSLYFGWRRIPWVLERTLSRSIPGLQASIGEVEIQENFLRVSGVVLKLRSEQEPFLKLREIAVSSSWEDLLGLQVAEVQIVEPELRISPAVLRALGLEPQPGKKRQPDRSPLPWSIRRLVCQYGTLQIEGFGHESLAARCRFAADLSELGPARLTPNEFTLWNIEVESSGKDILRLDLARGRFRLPDLLAGRRWEGLRIQGGKVHLTEALLGLFSGKTSGSSAGVVDAGEDGESLVLGELAIRGLGVQAPSGPLGTGFEFSVSTDFRNIPLSRAASALGQEVQKIAVADVEILSPLDPLSRVFLVRGLEVDFTMAGLLRSELETVRVVDPTIFVGQDLFWYMDDAQQRFGGNPDAPDDGTKRPAWRVKHFILTGGSLVLGSGGRREFGVPLTFHAEANNIAVDNLASLRAQVALQIPSRIYSFEDYQLEFETQDGELRFAYPPEKQENNLVGTVRLPKVRWRQYEASNAWVTVTFDREGINGEFGGVTYRGYSTGGFSFFFDTESPWIGWLGGKGLDMQKLTDVLSPENFRMTGPATYRLQLDARRTVIQRVKGDLQITRPGRMEIHKLNDLLERVPPEWPSFRQDGMKIALEALRDYDFDQCQADFWFVDRQGVLDLALKGPTGSRNFEVVLHADESPEGRWKQRTP
ncbi:MAG: hypothetical protein Fur0032_06620 [Terrimicrobiaceae bacterium]